MKAPRELGDRLTWPANYLSGMTLRRPGQWLLPLALCLAPFGVAAAQLVDLAVERQLARELGLSVGDTLRIGPAPDSIRMLGRVAAIYEPRPDPAEIAKRERHVRLHLPDLASLLGGPDRVDRLSIGLHPRIS